MILSSVISDRSCHEHTMVHGYVSSAISDAITVRQLKRKLSRAHMKGFSIRPSRPVVRIQEAARWLYTQYSSITNREHDTGTFLTGLSYTNRT